MREAFIKAAETFEGIGTSIDEARMKANAMCDTWMTVQRESGRTIIDDGRGSVTTRSGPSEFQCSVTLSYRVQAPSKAAG